MGDSVQCGSLVAPVVAPIEDATKTEVDKDEMRRRAREWVNRTVPMQMAEDDPPVVSRGHEKRGGGRDIWDSDDEGVETRVRQEDKPEAGAGGPGGATPFFMQVLGKQLGSIGD